MPGQCEEVELEMKSYMRCVCVCMCGIVLRLNKHGQNIYIQKPTHS